LALATSTNNNGLKKMDEIATSSQEMQVLSFIWMRVANMDGFY